MKPRKGNWLDTALRAQQAKTLDHHYRVHETQAAHEHAAQQESGARQNLHSLASSWRKGRDAAQLTKDLDGLYQRFHAQLHGEVIGASQARVAHQEALDAALQHLRQSHAIQQALDKTVARRDRRVVKDAQIKERSMATETWMLAQAGKKGSE
jgi:hypothetical protein